MIIGQFGESYPPTIDGVGGVMYNYCKEMDRRGHRSIFVGPDNKKSEPLTDCETVLYPSMRFSSKTPYRFGIPQMLPSVKKELMDIPFDIVHAHAPFFAGKMALEIKRKKNIPLVSTFHSKYYDDALRVTHSKVLAGKLIRMVLEFYDACDEIWTVNERTAAVLRGYGYHGPIVIMQNGIDPNEQQTLGDISDLNLSADVPQLLFVGQQDYKKGTRQLIDACGILKKQGKPFHLTMVGEGQDQEALMRQAEELGLEEEVLFTGKISNRPRLMAIYSQADLFVFPSVYDNAPLVVREAALVGTPSLVVEGSCAAEGMEDGVNGFLCDGTAEDIARRIEAALPAAAAVGEKARLSIPITWESIGGYVEERYQALVRKYKE